MEIIRRVCIRVPVRIGVEGAKFYLKYREYMPIFRIETLEIEALFRTFAEEVRFLNPVDASAFSTYQAMQVFQANLARKAINLSQHLTGLLIDSLRELQPLPSSPSPPGVGESIDMVA